VKCPIIGCCIIPPHSPDLSVCHGCGDEPVFGAWLCKNCIEYNNNNKNERQEDSSSTGSGSS
jgi:hypothetical protein